MSVMCRANNYEHKLKEINDIKDKMKKELKVKEEQLLVMKMNNEKITSLYEQKSQFLEKEVTTWKDKYHNALIETKNKENDLNKENINLKEQNKLLMRMEKKLEKNFLLDGNNNNNSFVKLRNSANTNTNNSNTNENTKRNINNLKNYVKNQLKENNNYNLESGIKIKDIKDMTNKGSQSNGERMRNYKDFSLKNTKTKYSADGKESKIRNIDEQLINLNQYKDKINTSKDFKCKFCLKSFSFPEYKEHFNICLKNPMNANNSITRNNYYKRNNNNDFISSNSNSNSNNNRKNSNNKLNNSNLNNNENTNKKYISINKDNNRKY